MLSRQDFGYCNLRMLIAVGERYVILKIEFLKLKLY